MINQNFPSGLTVSELLDVFIQKKRQCEVITAEKWNSWGDNLLKNKYNDFHCISD